MKILNMRNILSVIFFLISLYYVLGYYFLPNGTHIIEVWWIFLIIDTFILASRVNETTKRKDEV